MKARQSKSAKVIFRSESKGRAVLREIHKVASSKAHVVADVKLEKEHWRVKEL